MLREKVRGKMLFRNKETGEIRVTGEKVKVVMSRDVNDIETKA
jgi:hypothetical protein